MVDRLPGKYSDSENQAIAQDENGAMFCDPCYEDGDKKTADGFCVECQNYLCDQCFKYHCLPKPTKYHRLLSKSEMPKKKVEEDLSEICSHHEGETIQYYCKTHNTVGCNSCMHTDHKPCDGIWTLASIAQDVEQSLAYKEFCTRMDKTMTKVGDQIQTAKANIAICKSSKETAIADINDLQGEINQQFESMKQQITQKAEEKEEYDIRKIQTVEDSANDIKAHILSLTEDFKMLEETKQSKQLFIALNKCQEKLKNLEQKVEDIQKENKVQKYYFVPYKFLTSTLKNIDALGELCAQGQGESRKDLKSFYGNYPEYGIPKGTYISETKLIVLDTIYNHLRLFSEKRKTFVSEKLLTSIPWDIAALKKNRFVVTMPNEQKIKIMSVQNGNITENEDINVGARCEGIHYGEKKLFVACSKPAQVLILDNTGKNH